MLNFLEEYPAVHNLVSGFNKASWGKVSSAMRTQRLQLLDIDKHCLTCHRCAAMAHSGVVSGTQKKIRQEISFCIDGRKYFISSAPENVPSTPIRSFVLDSQEFIYDTVFL